MGTRTWEPPMIWASGKHGSKPAQAMIRLISSSLPISGNGLVVYSVVTGTCRLMRFTYRGEDSMIGSSVYPAAASLDSFLFLGSVCDRACISVQVVNSYPS